LRHGATIFCPLRGLAWRKIGSHPFRQDLIFNAIQMENGMVKVPDKPGIGVEVNLDVLRRYEGK
jgi:L-alanine-DL-glutamate epimerase-like enolase superfamily enzyme